MCTDEQGKFPGAVELDRPDDPAHLDGLYCKSGRSSPFRAALMLPRARDGFDLPRHDRRLVTSMVNNTKDFYEVSPRHVSSHRPVFDANTTCGILQKPGQGSIVVIEVSPQAYGCLGGPRAPPGCLGPL